jgi:hypothetical protein
MHGRLNYWFKGAEPGQTHPKTKGTRKGSSSPSEVRKILPSPKFRLIISFTTTPSNCDLSRYTTVIKHQ